MPSTTIKTKITFLSDELEKVRADYAQKMNEINEASSRLQANSQAVLQLRERLGNVYVSAVDTVADGIANREMDLQAGAAIVRKALEEQEAVRIELDIMTGVGERMKLAHEKLARPSKFVKTDIEKLQHSEYRIKQCLSFWRLLNDFCRQPDDLLEKNIIKFAYSNRSEIPSENRLEADGLMRDINRQHDRYYNWSSCRL